MVAAVRQMLEGLLEPTLLSGRKTDFGEVPGYSDTGAPAPEIVMGPQGLSNLSAAQPDFTIGPSRYVKPDGTAGPLVPEYTPAEAEALARNSGLGMVDQEKAFGGYVDANNNMFTAEVPDDSIAFLPTFIAEMNQRPATRQKPKQFTLDQVLSHDYLFDAYPQIRNLSVKIVNEANETKGAAYSSGKGLVINTNNTSIEDTMATFVHELQHVAQVYENRVLGGDPTNIAADYYMKNIARGTPSVMEAANIQKSNDYFKKLSNSKNPKLRAKYDSLMEGFYKDYLSLYGEAEARNAEFRYYSSNKKKQENRPFSYSFFRKTLETLARDPTSQVKGVTRENLTKSSLFKSQYPKYQNQPDPVGRGKTTKVTIT